MDAMVVLAVAAALFAAIELAAMTGLFAAAAGERVERCARCHHMGVTSGGVVHREGCPHRLGLHLSGSHGGLHPGGTAGLGHQS